MPVLVGKIRKLFVTGIALLTVIITAYVMLSREAPRPAYAEDFTLEVKSMGDPEAPVKLYEFSSLTCGHCGAFHHTTLKELKSEFIETGKVYYVYNDFPLNKPALDASLISRCMPEEKFWNFLDFLFAQQNEWAFGSKDYLKALKQNAKLAGLSGEAVQSCLDNKSKAEALAMRMQQAAKKYEIDATPTFIITTGDKQEKLVGNQSVITFKNAINKLLEQEDGNQP